MFDLLFVAILGITFGKLLLLFYDSLCGSLKEIFGSQRCSIIQAHIFKKRYKNYFESMSLSKFTKSKKTKYIALGYDRQSVPLPSLINYDNSVVMSVGSVYSYNKPHLRVENPLSIDTLKLFNCKVFGLIINVKYVHNIDNIVDEIKSLIDHNGTLILTDVRDQFSDNRILDFFELKDTHQNSLVEQINDCTYSRGNISVYKVL